MRTERKLAMKKIKAFFIIGIFLFGVGVFLVFNSVSFGNAMLNNMIIKAGGIYDTEGANIALSAYISNFRIIGVAIMCLGGVSSLWSAMKILGK